jgi:hypothetical protein
MFVFSIKLIFNKVAVVCSTPNTRLSLEIVFFDAVLLSSAVYIDNSVLSVFTV